MPVVRAGTCARWRRGSRSRSDRRRPGTARPTGRRRGGRGLRVPGCGADVLGGVDQAALGWDVRDRDELHRTGVVGEPAAKVAHGELPGLVVVDDFDDGAGARGDLEEGDDIAGVLGPGGQDPVAGREREPVEGHVPGAGGVLHDRYLGGLAADEPGDGVVGVFDLVVGFGRGLVAADLGLAVQVGDHGVGDLGRRQGGAGIVEVRDVRGPRGVAAGSLDVERRHVHDRSLSWVKSRSKSHAEVVLVIATMASRWSG